MSAITDAPEIRLRRPLVVVSNREPYQHTRARDGSIQWSPTTGGVAVALDALMRERGGVWIAHGSGDADRDVVDEHDRVIVPPDHPGYTLRRLWLTEEEAKQYYEGFANEGLWPLCHEAHVRPIFRKPDWERYQQVNDRFADVIEGELPDLSAPVFIQDYHLALVAARLRRRQPGVKTAIFWHIPWPSADRLRILPLAARDPDRSSRKRSHCLPARSRSPQLPGRGPRERSGGDAQHGPHGEPHRGGQGGAYRCRLRPHSAHHAGSGPRGGAGAPAAGARARHAADRDRGRPPRLHEGRSGAPRRPGAAAGAAQRRARQAGRSCRSASPRVPASRATVDVVEAIDRKVADINARHGSGAGHPLPEVVVSDQASRGALPARQLLHRQLAARRHEPGGQGVRCGAGGRGRGAGPERDGVAPRSSSTTRCSSIPTTSRASPRR